MSSYSNYSQFESEVLQERAGPLVSPAEDMADDMYNNSINEQFNSMWDDVDADE